MYVYLHNHITITGADERRGVRLDVLLQGQNMKRINDLKLRLVKKSQ